MIHGHKCNDVKKYEYLGACSYADNCFHKLKEKTVKYHAKIT